MDSEQPTIFGAYRNWFRLQFALVQKAITQKTIRAGAMIASLASGVPPAVEGETLIITAINPEALTA